MVTEISFETGRIFFVRDSRRVLVKVVLFHLNGHGHSQVNAMPIFINSFNSQYLDLSKEIYNVSVSYTGQEKIVKNHRGVGVPVEYFLE